MEKSYFNENRYFDADVLGKKVNLDIDENSPIYTNYEHETLDKQDSIKLLDSFIEKDSFIREIVDKIPTSDIKNKVVLSIEDINKFFSFATIHLSNKYTYIEIFDICTDYLSMDAKFFYSKLSIKFKEYLLKELEKVGMYKSKALF